MTKTILSENRQSDWRIVIPCDPMPGVQNAAREFAEFFAAVSGAALPIVSESEPAQPHEILIGTVNRDFAAIRKLKSWCDDHGKKLYALANSGCLNHCSAHTFHDNLVSHEQEISVMDNAFAFTGICGNFLRKKENLNKILDCTGFIRPEDIYLFEDLFPAMKLATRVSADPVRILQAYIDRKRHIGSALDLLEPNHTGTIYPYFLENSDIHAVVSQDTLVYSNIENALIKLEEDMYVNQ